MIQKYFLFLVFLFVVGFAFSQDTLTYEIKTNFFKLGNMHAVKMNDDKNMIEKYTLQSSFVLWSVYTINYNLETVFKHGILNSSKALITANNKTKHFCYVERKQDFYLRTLGVKTDTLKINAIKTGITQIYFEDYAGPDSIYSEFSGRFLPFQKIDSNEYLLGVKDIQRFTFNNHSVEKVTIPNSILDFFIILK